jgi:hypothetical protein
MRVRRRECEAKVKSLAEESQTKLGHDESEESQITS